MQEDNKQTSWATQPLTSAVYTGLLEPMSTHMTRPGAQPYSGSADRSRQQLPFETPLQIRSLNPGGGLVSTPPLTYMRPEELVYSGVEGNAALPPESVDVVCGDLRGVFRWRTGKISYYKKDTNETAEAAPTDFEKAGGRSATKKWKQSIRIHNLDGTSGRPLGEWLSQHGIEYNSRNFIPGGVRFPPSQFFQGGYSGQTPPGAPAQPQKRRSSSNLTDVIATKASRSAFETTPHSAGAQEGWQGDQPPNGVTDALDEVAVGGRVVTGSHAAEVHSERLKLLGDYLSGNQEADALSQLGITPLSVGGRPMELRELWHAVSKLGGYGHVSHTSAWHLVARHMGVSVDQHPNSPFTLRAYFQQVLLPLERHLLAQASVAPQLQQDEAAGQGDAQDHVMQAGPDEAAAELGDTAAGGDAVPGAVAGVSLQHNGLTLSEELAGVDPQQQLFSSMLTEGVGSGAGLSPVPLQVDHTSLLQLVEQQRVQQQQEQVLQGAPAAQPEQVAQLQADGAYSSDFFPPPLDGTMQGTHDLQAQQGAEAAGTGVGVDVREGQALAGDGTIKLEEANAEGADSHAGDASGRAEGPGAPVGMLDTSAHMVCT